MQSVVRRADGFVWRIVSEFVTELAFMVRRAIEGQQEPREHMMPNFVICPDHGRTTLERQRQTACCASTSFDYPWPPARAKFINVSLGAQSADETAAGAE